MRKPAEPPREINLLFVCLGNSCRSQMAEALTRRLGEGKVRAWSAGSRPLGYILPETAEVLKGNYSFRIGSAQRRTRRGKPLPTKLNKPRIFTRRER